MRILEDPREVAHDAAMAKLSPDAFRAQFGYLVANAWKLVTEPIFASAPVLDAQRLGLDVRKASDLARSQTNPVAIMICAPRAWSVWEIVRSEENVRDVQATRRRDQYPGPANRDVADWVAQL